MAIHLALESLPPFLWRAAAFSSPGRCCSFVLRSSSWRNFHWGHRRRMARRLVVGTLLLVGGNGSVAWAQQYVNTSTAALIFGTIPLCIIFFDWLRPGGVRPSLRTGLGFALGFAGLCILIKPSRGRCPTRAWKSGASSRSSSPPAPGRPARIYSRHVHAQGSPLLPMARQMISGGLVLAGHLRRAWGLEPLFARRRSRAAWLGLRLSRRVRLALGFTAYVWLLRVSTPRAGLHHLVRQHRRGRADPGWPSAANPMSSAHSHRRGDHCRLGRPRAEEEDLRDTVEAATPEPEP